MFVFFLSFLAQFAWAVGWGETVLPYQNRKVYARLLFIWNDNNNNIPKRRHKQRQRQRQCGRIFCACACYFLLDTYSNCVPYMFHGVHSRIGFSINIFGTVHRSPFTRIWESNGKKKWTKYYCILCVFSKREQWAESDRWRSDTNRIKWTRIIIYY